MVYNIMIKSLFGAEMDAVILGFVRYGF